MSEPPRSYTERRDLIAQKLEPYLRVSTMLPKNSRPTSPAAEKFWDNSLWCVWGDRDTGNARTVAVSVYQAGDGEREAEGVRDMIREECRPGVDLQARNAEAYELIGQRPGEYAFVLEYLGRVTAVVDHCVVTIWQSDNGVELSQLADVALDIGRTVGCSAYENDFTLPEIPEAWCNQPVGWSTEGFPPYIPGPKD